LQHPELIAAFMNCCAIDFLTGFIGKKLEDITESLTDGLDGIALQIENLK
jgi:hypothetical protein